MSTTTTTKTNEVTKLPPPNKAAIEYLFKRACHTINAHSPLEMSDPTAVSRVLGELFQQMQADEKAWSTDLRTAKGWICDFPEKLGGGAMSLTAVNIGVSRLQVRGNAHWNTPDGKPLEIDAKKRGELEEIMLKFAQEGSLVEQPQVGDSTSSSSSASSSLTTTRISLMKDSSSNMRVFNVKLTSGTRKKMKEMLSFAQMLNQSQNPDAMLMATGSMSF